MSKIRCGIGDCTYSHELARVVGRHKQAKHGIAGSAPSTLQRHKAKRHISIQAVASPVMRSLAVPEKAVKKEKKWQCPYCAKAPYNSDNGLRHHIENSHPAEFARLRSQGLGIVSHIPLTGRQLARGFSKNGHLPETKPVSLVEAIQVLQVEADTLLGVIARLRQLQQGS